MAKSRAANMKRAGRPRKKFDWSAFEKLCYLNCSEEEIASFFECAVSTLQRAVRWHYGVNFAQINLERKNGGKIKLREKQMEVALNGNVTMLIWLGKQMLNQSDKAEIDAGAGINNIIKLAYNLEETDAVKKRV